MNYEELLQKITMEDVWNYDRYCCYVLEFMWANGLRVSDVLDIKRNDIDRYGNINVVQSKRSNAKRCSSISFQSFWIEYRAGQHPALHNLNRQKIWRFCKRFGVGSYDESRLHQRTTHAGREYFIQDTQNRTGNIEITAQIAGHKSTKSTEEYLKKTQNKLRSKKGLISSVEGSNDFLQTKTLRGEQYIFLKKT